MAWRTLAATNPKYPPKKMFTTGSKNGKEMKQVMMEAIIVRIPYQGKSASSGFCRLEDEDEDEDEDER